jgi:hypothetical protein
VKLIVPASRVAREGQVVNGNVVPNGETGIVTDLGVFMTSVDGITLGNPTREAAPGTRAVFSDSAFVTEAQVVADAVTGGSLVESMPGDWRYPDPEL